MDRIMQFLGYVRAGQQAQQQPRLQAQQPADPQPRPQRLAPIINPEPDEAAIGPMRGFQNNQARKRRFEDIANNSINSYPEPRDEELDDEEREYRTAESEGWLTPFPRRPQVMAGDPQEILNRNKKAVFALLYFSAHQITKGHMNYVLKGLSGLGAYSQVIRGEWRAKFKSWQHDVCTVYVSPRAEAGYTSMITPHT